MEGPSQTPASGSNPHPAGLGARVRCRCERSWLGAVRRVFKFDPWHVSATYACRPYKRRVVEIVNSLRPGLVAEVGCGLGDILTRIRASERIGVDLDAAVIRAARFLHPRAAHWIHGDASALATAVPAGRRVDCLIMVNWIHNLSPAVLHDCLLPLLNRVDHLVVDAIDADASGSYRYRHDFAFLAAHCVRVSALRVPGEPRTFLTFRIAR